MNKKSWSWRFPRAGAKLLPDRRTAAARMGRRAERHAERLLRRHGLRTLARNYARRTGEIDLVMLDGDVLAFVEVRYRAAAAWTSGLASVNVEKRRRLTRTAERYLAEHPEHQYRAIRFDVVSASRGNYRLPWNKRQKGACDGGVSSMDRSAWLGRGRTRRTASGEGASFGRGRVAFGALACEWIRDAFDAMDG